MNAETKIKDIRTFFRKLKALRNAMTPSQAAFVTSTQKYFSRNKTLSEKQMNILQEIKRYVKSVEYVNKNSNHLQN